MSAYACCNTFNSPNSMLQSRDGQEPLKFPTPAMPDVKLVLWIMACCVPVCCVVYVFGDSTAFCTRNGALALESISLYSST
eukprot:1075899-Ditylum_brightwellii.AAC.1